MESPQFAHWIAGRPRASTRGAQFLQLAKDGSELSFARAGIEDLEQAWQALSTPRPRASRSEVWALLNHALFELRRDENLPSHVASSLALEPDEARAWLDADLFACEEALEILRDGGEGAPRGNGVFVAHWSDGIGRLTAKCARALLCGDSLLFLGDPRLPWGPQALARALFTAGLDDSALALLWDDTWTMRRAVLGDARCTWYRAAGTPRDLLLAREAARPGLDLALWPMENRSLPLPDDFDPDQAADAAIEQAFGRAATLSGQAPGHVARVICPERRFAAFTEALLARLDPADLRSVPGLEDDFSSDLEAAWRLALDEGTSPIHGEPGGDLPLVLTNVDPRMRLARTRRPRPLLCLIRARNASEALQLARELDGPPIPAAPSRNGGIGPTGFQESGAPNEAAGNALEPSERSPQATMSYATQVHEILKRHQLADGYPFVFDLERSQGPWLVDARDGTKYLDLFTCFASWPIGYNHPRMSEVGFRRELDLAAANNPANSDLYTESMARFVEAFATRVTPPGFKHHFWISGGALAVENAMKVAFDWKAGKLGRRSFEDDANDLVVLHLRQAFHGRSGYTISVTNTDPVKIGLFPKFAWPRVHNPAIEFDLDGGIANDIVASEARAEREIEAAFAKHPKKIACILLEPMQGEGGDNHFRPEFLKRLRRFADDEEALLVFDEVQTGFFGTGSPWMWQKLGVRPDVVAFGKKTQVCGLYAGPRVDEVTDNVFTRVSRINSTWGGNLTDMVRCRQFIDIILGEKMHENVAVQGERFIAGLRRIAKSRASFTNVRGVGSLIAFTLESPVARDEFLLKLRERNVLALKSGAQAIRFRMPFVVGAEEIDWALDRIESCLPAGVQGAR
ncbi:MAG TPA: L-lysine 6-transaminase [Planctomycetota bacterium]|nr:L-lysine 6-transaminase [Planctomycetota bacterium]